MVIPFVDREEMEGIIPALRAGHAWADFAGLVEDRIQRSLSAPEYLRAAWQSTGKLSLLYATYHVPLDRDSVGRRLQSLIDSVLEYVRYLQLAADEVQLHGQAVRSLPRLLEVIREIEAIRSEAFDNWPWKPTREEWDEAVAEFERGDSLPADEAFAEIAGVDKDAWLRRVEEYKRRRDGKDHAP